jgi:hypothetical protein
MDIEVVQVSPKICRFRISHQKKLALSYSALCAKLKCLAVISLNIPCIHSKTVVGVIIRLGSLISSPPKQLGLHVSFYDLL